MKDLDANYVCRLRIEFKNKDTVKKGIVGVKVRR